MASAATGFEAEDSLQEISISQQKSPLSSRPLRKAFHLSVDYTESDFEKRDAVKVKIPKRRARRSFHSFDLFRSNDKVKLESEEEEEEAPGRIDNCMDRIDQCCNQKNERCWRGIKHCAFFVLLAISFIWSSIARIVLIIDMIITTGLFLRCPNNLDVSFQDSSLDILILCLLRCIGYFALFAYKYRRDLKVWIGVMSITAGALFYIFVKIGAAFTGVSSDEVKHLVIFQLCFVIGEIALFQFLRQRPIGEIPRARNSITPTFEKDALVNPDNAISSQQPQSGQLEKLELSKIEMHDEIHTSYSPITFEVQEDSTHQNEIVPVATVPDPQVVVQEQKLSSDSSASIKSTASA